MAQPTTCPEHRRQGYKYDWAGLLVCKGCGLPSRFHETNEETAARLATEAAPDGVCTSCGAGPGPDWDGVDMSCVWCERS